MTTFLLIAGFPDSLLTFRGPLLDALLACGLTVHVAAPDLPAGSDLHRRLLARGLVAHEIPLRRAGMNPLADLWLLLYLWRLLRRIRPDMVLAYTIKPVIYGSLAAWLARTPRRFALITGLGYAFRNPGAVDDGLSPGGWLRSLAQGLYRLALRRVDKTFFQNPDDEALFRRLGVLTPPAISVVVNGSGVDLTEYAMVPVPAAPRFLLIARLLGDKGVHEYAEAARCLRRQHPQARFSLVGWIDDSPDAIAQRELDGWVAEGALEFLGRLADVRSAIAAASVYVLPSYHEGTPRTVLEAMAMGRAIITTDAPGCRETVMEGDNGLLIPVRSVPALVEAMERFIAEPGLAERMGRRSRQVAEAKYDVRKVNAVMLREMGISPEGKR